MRYPTPRSCAFVFVCQRGRLEAESVLLAASLRRHLRCEYELIAMQPGPTEWMEPPSPATIEALGALGVRVVPVRNEIVAARQSSQVQYLLTNKIFALRVPTAAEKLVLLDSDQLCRQPLSPASCLSAPLGARRADFVSSREVGPAWESIFRAAAVPCPGLRIQIRNGGGEQREHVYAPPSFNSSFVSIDSALAADFSRVWEDCFRRIDASGEMRHIRYYQEQASLTVAAVRSGLPYEMLDLDWLNPALSHYFDPHSVRDNRELLELARSLVQTHSALAPVVRNSPEWSFL